MARGTPGAFQPGAPGMPMHHPVPGILFFRSIDVFMKEIMHFF
jgi:hypothetical protein